MTYIRDMFRKLKSLILFILLLSFLSLRAEFSVININNENIIHKVNVSRKGMVSTFIVVTEKDQSKAFSYSVYHIEIENKKLISKKQIFMQAVIKDEEFHVNKLVKLSDNRILMVSNTFNTGNDTYIGRVFSESGEIVQAKIICEKVNYRTAFVHPKAENGFYLSNFIDDASEHEFYEYDKDLNLIKKSVVNYEGKIGSQGLSEVYYKNGFAYPVYIAWLNSEEELNNSYQLAIFKIDLVKSEITNFAGFENKFQIRNLGFFSNDKGLEVFCTTLTEINNEASAKAAKIFFDWDKMTVKLTQSEFPLIEYFYMQSGYDVQKSESQTDKYFLVKKNENRNTYTVMMRLGLESSNSTMKKNSAGKLNPVESFNCQFLQGLIFELDSNFNLIDSAHRIDNGHIFKASASPQIWLINGFGYNFEQFTLSDEKKEILIYFKQIGKDNFVLYYQFRENGIYKKELHKIDMKNSLQNNFYLNTFEEIAPGEYVCIMNTQLISRLVFW